MGVEKKNKKERGERKLKEEKKKINLNFIVWFDTSNLLFLLLFLFPLLLFLPLLPLYFFKPNMPLKMEKF